MRILYSVDDPIALLAAYRVAYPPLLKEGIERSEKSLSQFLSEGTNLRRHFSFKYFSLECTSKPFSTANLQAQPLDKEVGKNTISSLLRVDFVEAQRNIDDLEAARSNRLSSVFADFYRYNLEQSGFDAAAVSVINASNENLSKHYETQFKPLLDVIGLLGFPSINDRSLRILSSLSADFGVAREHHASVCRAGFRTPIAGSHTMALDLKT